MRTHLGAAALLGSLVLLILAGPRPLHAAAGAPKRLLAIFAHPDDELLVSGALVRAQRRGIDVRTVYVTSGDAGQDRTGLGRKGAVLGAAREAELKRALRALGLPRGPILLRWPDGQIEKNLARIVVELKRTIADLAPDVVLTFGPDGVTGHRDHVAVGLATQAAYDSTHQPRSLFAFGVSQRSIMSIAAHVSQFPLIPVDASRIDADLDVIDTAILRTASMRAYGSQFEAPLRDVLERWFHTVGRNELIRLRGTTDWPW